MEASFDDPARAWDDDPGERRWENAWTDLVTSLDYWPEIRRVIYSTKKHDQVARARMRRVARTRGHFSNHQKALKCLYMSCADSPSPGVVEGDG